MLSVEMVSTLYIQLWHGEIDHSVRLWNLHGRQMENMLLEKAHQRLRFSVKISRFVYMSSEMLEAADFFSPNFLSLLLESWFSFISSKRNYDA